MVPTNRSSGEEQPIENDARNDAIQDEIVPFERRPDQAGEHRAFHGASRGMALLSGIPCLAADMRMECDLPDRPAWDGSSTMSAPFVLPLRTALLGE